MKKSLNEIVGIVDRSGSMQSLVNDAIGGLNRFFEDQKKLPGKAMVTVALFDNQYELIYDNVPIAKVKKWTDKNYVPRGMTALLDAIGKTISTVKERQNALAKKDFPEKTIVFVLTDGLENASREYDKNAIQKLIDEQRGKDWEFIFLAADEATIKDAVSMGLRRADTQIFAKTSAGVGAAYVKTSAITTNYRT